MKKKLLLYFAVIAENNFITSYVSNLCEVIYRKCRGTQFKFDFLSSTPHCFFLNSISRNTLFSMLADWKTGAQLFLHVPYVVRQIKYFLTYVWKLWHTKQRVKLENKASLPWSHGNRLGIWTNVLLLKILEQLNNTESVTATNYHSTTLLNLEL